MSLGVKLTVLLAPLLAVGCSSQTSAVATSGEPAPLAPLSTALPAGLSTGQSIEVIAEESRYAFEADGRKTHTYRITYRILSAAALDQWGTISADWTPWYQDPPDLSATVTTPRGKKYLLDKNSVAEVPAGTGDRRLFSDRRRMVAPLPGIEVGALVEQVTVERDRRAFFAEGTVGRFYFGMQVPVFLSRLVLEAPEDLPLQWVVRGAEMKPEIDITNGRRTVTFEMAPVMPQGTFERFLPPESPRYPYVAFSTSKTWQGVASRYAALVEQKLLGADVSELMKGVDEKQPRQALIEELVRRLHAHVRYTGIEFGRQAIIPWTPKETLARGYGDCKDKSTLLVAMLRVVGIEAHLAILKSGYGEDALGDLPGLESFNHAIVYVSGTPGLWIDATADLTPVGELPTSVQGRKALIASFDTTTLVQIPEHAATHAYYHELRTVELAPWGPAKIREATFGTGAMQDKLRVQYAGTPKLQVGEALERYVRSSYKAKRLGSFEMTDARDLTKPFLLTIEAEDAQVAYTSARDATVELRPAVLYSWLPEELRLAALAEAGEDNAERHAAAEEILSRHEDFVFPEPYAADLVYDIVFPAGFELSKRPDDRRTDLGPGYVEERYEVFDDRVRATFAIDLVKRRYSADEIRAFVVGLYEVFDSTLGRIELRHRGARLLAEGATREALAVYRRLVDAAPNDAYHRARFADVLLEVGLGGPAREQIKKAMALAPDSSRVTYVAAVVFSHDLFGRRFFPGFDRDAAIDAYRRVLAVEPEHHEARFSLAVLLEHDDQGVRYGNLEGVKEAVELYRLLPSEGRAKHANNLLIGLYEAGDFDGLESAAEAAAPSRTRNALLLVALAITENVDAGFSRIESLRLPAEALQEIYDDAATSLAHARRYELAAEVMKRAARSSSDPIAAQQRLATLSKLRRYEEHRSPRDNPVSIVERMLEAIFAPRLDLPTLEGLFVDVGDEDAVREEIRTLTSGFTGFLAASKKAGVPIEMMRDNVLALTQFHAEGDDSVGYRVSGTVAGSEGRRISWWFVVKDKGAYRLRATEASLPSVGEEALHLLARRRDRAARKWLNWAKEITPYRSGPDPLSESPFLALWSGGSGSPRLAAAALQALGSRGDRVIDVLEAERKKENAPEVRMHIDHALLMALAGTKNTKKLLEVSTRLYRQLPRSEAAFGMYVGALVEAGRATEAIDLLAKRINERPRDVLARARLADLLTITGDKLRAEAVMRDSIRLGVATPSTYNNLAWLRLFADDVGESDVALALEANTMTSFENPSHLHTLAALYAETGKTREALQLVLRRMEMANIETPESSDWYLLGRIMHDYGLIDLARDAYERVENDEDRPTDSTWALSRMKLRQLTREASGKRI